MKFLNSILVVSSLLVSGCLLMKENTSPYSIQTIYVYMYNKAGNPYVNTTLEARFVGVSGTGTDWGVTDGSGKMTLQLFSPQNFDLIAGSSPGGRPFVYAHDGQYEAQIYVTNDSGHVATFREVTYYDSGFTPASATMPPVTTEMMFASSFTLAAQVDYCSAGIGILFPANYHPPGMHISVYDDNAGEPGNLMLDSTDIEMFEVIGLTANNGFGGLAGNFCDLINPIRSLNAGTYWVVATFASPPNSAVAAERFNMIGNVALGSNGLSAMVSSDGGASWSAHTYVGGGESRQSMLSFLTE